MPPRKKEKTITRNMNDIRLAIKLSIHKLIIDCKQYDNGDLNALYGDSSILRNLFYNSRQNTPLLQLAQAHKDIRLLSYTNYQGNDIDYGSAIIARLPDDFLNQSNDYITTYLFDPEQLKGKPHKLPFNRWWEQPIFKFNKTIINRRVLVKIDANQNGGAHFDKDIDESYYNLLNGNTGFQFDIGINNYQSIFGADFSQIGKHISVTNLPGALLREVIHETILSFSNYFDFINEPYKYDFEHNILRSTMHFRGNFKASRKHK